MGFIDTDAHVLECEATWDHLDPSERKYRPVKMEVESPNGGRPKQIYLIGDMLCRRFPTDGRGAGYGFEYSADITHLENPALRVEKMNALGVDVQIVISTNFIAAQLEDPYAEAAIMRSWNRWMAERTQGYTDRLRWVMVCPTRTPERAGEEMEWCAKHGAAGVMIKGVDHGYDLSSPYFYPIYERAQDLNLTIVVHQGGARDHIELLGITSAPAATGDWLRGIRDPMRGFASVIGSDLNKRFPRLRFAFVESGAAWVPYVLLLKQRNRALIDPGSFVQWPEGPTRHVPHLDFAAEMEAHRMFVSGELDEDLDYLAAKLGPNCIMIGTDMCHNDNGTNLRAHTQLMARTDIGEDIKRRMVDDNGRAAFAISKDFRPTDKLSAEERKKIALAVI
jgi:predicted TIM-barrel fold metal-dependent hydrolase